MNAWAEKGLGYRVWIDILYQLLFTSKITSMPSKRNLATFAAIVFFTAKLIAQWESYPLPLPQGFNDLIVVEDTVFGMGEKGIYRSNDGGKSWSFFVGGRSFAVHPQTKAYYTVHANRVIFKSVDYGNSWTKEDSVSVAQTQTLRLFFDDTIIYAFNQNRLFRRDSLNAWTQLEYTLGTIIDCVARGNRIWLAELGNIWYSQDSGDSWTKLFIPSSFYKRTSLVEIGDTLLFCGAGSYGKPFGYLYRSIDNGDSWQADSTQTHLTRVFDDERHFFAADDNGRIYRSPNGLTDWSIIKTSGHSFFINDVTEVNGEVVLSTSQGVMLEDDQGDWAYRTTLTTQDSLIPGYSIQLRFHDGVVLTDRNPNTLSFDLGKTWIRRDGYGPPDYPLVKVGNFLMGKKDNHFVRCLDDGQFNWQHTSDAQFTPGRLAAMGNVLYATEFKYTLEDTRIFRSDDYGDSWIQTGISPTFETQLYGPHAPNNFWALDSLLIGLSDWILYVSSDEGQTWLPRYQFPNPSLYSYYNRLFVIDDQLYMASFEFQKLYVSSDKGFSFDTIQTPKTPIGNYNYLFRVHGKTLLLTPSDGFLHFSKDQGTTWLKILPPKPGDIHQNANYNAAEDSTILLMDYESGLVWRLNVKDISSFSGTVFLDINSNGQQDGLEPGVPDLVVQPKKSNQFFAVTGAAGKYLLYVSGQADTLELASNLPYYAPMPPYHVVQAGNTDPVNFALQPIGPVTDVSVNMVATSVFRPGFKNAITATLSNAGTVPASGTLCLVVDPNLTVLDITPMPDWQSDDTLFWQFTSLEPFQHLNFQIQAETNVQAFLGDTVRLSAMAKTNDIDISPTDNEFGLEAVVVGSYDPNDKAVLPTHITPFAAQDGAELIYTIRFQNTGTYPTAFVELRDTLSEWVDPGSVRILASSHTFSWSLHGRELRFQFNPLQLPPQTADELRSQGFVQFAVHMKPGAVLGDTIQNTAHIYFDFNLPIETNTVHSTIKETSSVITIIKNVEPEILIYPNPTTSEIWINWAKLGTQPSQIYLLTIDGKLLNQFHVSQNGGTLQRLSLTSLPFGSYLLVVEINGQKKFVRVVNKVPGN
ncbi:MAG: T9SS type A sorting domain-containing protein [Lewinellaceae bacterium]|nr:T9SS type A sorting domain-containing protein [Lewinellaceae bacterium]